MVSCLFSDSVSALPAGLLLLKVHEGALNVAVALKLPAKLDFWRYIPWSIVNRQPSGTMLFFLGWKCGLFSLYCLIPV